MVSPNPLQLVALMHTQLRQRRLVPPILPILTATALARILRRTGHRPTALARVNLEPPVRRHERRVAPVRLHTPPLRRPIVRVPYRALHSHCLVLRAGCFVVAAVGRILVIPSALKMQNLDTERILWTPTLRVELRCLKSHWGVCGYGLLALGLSGGHLATAVVSNSGS
ncbi:hypothetical protein G2W53_008316 [Senna tora]|uniref:Uncharacterized protein n=1 Tax=Senna tora TaxID=362788 RepID=A0A835CF42_9FABA|nr:hypothetical protein G2W53_008316 [Senna tora]